MPMLISSSAPTEACAGLIDISSMDRGPARASGYQLTYDCRAARCKDCTLKDEGKTSVWFQPIDCHKQECTGEADRQNIKTGHYGNQIRQSRAFPGSSPLMRQFLGPRLFPSLNSNWE